MKNLFFTLLLVFTALTVSAEIGVTTVVDNLAYDSRGVAMEIDDEGCALFSFASYSYKYDEDKEEVGEISVTIYDDNFQLIKKINIKSPGGNIKTLRNDYNNDMAIVASYNWIVNNDKWCILVEASNLDETGNDKFIVFDEDGNNLGELPFIYPYIVFDSIVGGKPYIIGTRDDAASDNYIESIYQFTGTNSVQAVKVANMSAYPNPLRGGQTFTINLPREADSKTVVVVTDMSGRQVERKHIESGAQKAFLRHSSLNGGQCIYTVIYGDGYSVSGKLLVE